MNAVVNLVVLSFQEKIVLGDELEIALREVKEGDFLTFTNVLENISKDDLIKAWYIIQELKNVVESNRREVLHSTHRMLWKHQRG